MQAGISRATLLVTGTETGTETGSGVGRRRSSLAAAVAVAEAAQGWSGWGVVRLRGLC